MSELQNLLEALADEPDVAEPTRCSVPPHHSR